jgi:membrane-associated protease RseP (regulator of RpoE activity)
MVEGKGLDITSFYLAPMMPADMLSEVEQVKSIVARYFPIYDVRVSYQSITIFITPVVSSLDETFERLRIEMNEKKFIPFITYKGGEYTITIMRKGDRPPRGIWVNVILLALTVVTTIIAGAAFYGAYVGDNDLFSVSNLLWGGLTFALPLMTILGVHELSHFYAAKRNHVAASLPFFIPSFPPLGTLGAFISLRDPMPNRKALIEIGIAGPIGGLLVTIPIAILGLWLTANGTTSSGYVAESGLIGFVLQPMYQFFLLFIPMPDNAMMHPVGVAAWVGFLVTAINLLPAGQLDGGHVARGFLGENAKYLSYLTMGVLFLLGVLFYSGWLIFAILVMFLGVRHPQPLNDLSDLKMSSKILGALAIVLLLVTFVIQPVVEINPDYGFKLDVSGPSVINATAGSTVLFTMDVKNSGNTNYSVLMVVSNVTTEWGRGLYLANGTASNATETLSFLLPYQGSDDIVLKLIVPSAQEIGPREIVLNIVSKNSQGDTMSSLRQGFLVNIVP